MNFLALNQQGVFEEVKVQDATGLGNVFQEYRPLTAEEVDQGFIDVFGLPMDGSVYFMLGSVTQLEGIDFEIEYHEGGFRIVFVGDLLPTGLTPPEAGEPIYIQFTIETFGSAFEYHKLSFSLTSDDIGNQYFEVPGTMIAGTEKIMTGGVTLKRNFDYTLLGTGTATRVLFIEDTASGGASELGETDFIQILYAATN